MTNFEKVLQFHEVFNLYSQADPGFPPGWIVSLRLGLIEEELAELDLAIREDNLVEVADALADLLYVVYGTAAAFGIDADACFEEVHRSNMTKAGEDGKPIYREDGKLLKGPNFTPPDLRALCGVAG